MMSDAREDALLAVVNRERAMFGIVPVVAIPPNITPDTRLALNATTAITAYLGAMADAGWVMVEDVGAMEIDGPSPARSYAYAWNACRAAMLADPRRNGSIPMVTEDRMAETVAMWQPIETAPRDGTRVLVWCGDVYVAYWNKSPSVVVGASVPCWTVFEPDDYYFAVHLIETPPTHWRQLPKGPDA